MSIRILRERRGLDQASLAKQIEIPPAYLSRIEAGKQTPSLKVLQDLCRVLEASEVDLGFLIAYVPRVVRVEV